MKQRCQKASDRRSFKEFAASLPFLVPRFDRDRRPARSRVAILNVNQYSEKLVETLFEGLKLFNLDVSWKSVLLKPNLVDYIPGAHINTHPLLVAAAAECFKRLGARSVVVGEGPGHHRDTYLVVHKSGLLEQLRRVAVPFVDLNRDDLVKTKLRADYSGLHEIWLPRTVLEADFIVSMPKIKTHHWSGVTLSMKNMFGVVPGVKYGWPKNILHWKGIERCIVDICATVPIHFVIADGIVAMEGNGPLAGSPRHLGKLVLANDPVAADATCARLMGFVPERVPHIAAAGKFLGNMSVDGIDQMAGQVVSPIVPFEVVQEFEDLRARANRSLSTPQQ
jgi:uncharacterized protein (DUF362 family)